MARPELFLFVEGADDTRFFQQVLCQVLERTHGTVKVIEFAQMKREKLESYIQSINSMGASYLFFRDLNNAPCVTARKEEISGTFSHVAADRIIVVGREIEGWYLAGLPEPQHRKWNVRAFAATDDVTKEYFETLVPKQLKSRLAFMLALLECYSIADATRRNKSFRYFWQKFGLSPASTSKTLTG